MNDLVRQVRKLVRQEFPFPYNKCGEGSEFYSARKYEMYDGTSVPEVHFRIRPEVKEKIKVKDLFIIDKDGRVIMLINNYSEAWRFWYCDHVISVCNSISLNLDKLDQLTRAAAVIIVEEILHGEKGAFYFLVRRRFEAGLHRLFFH